VGFDRRAPDDLDLNVLTVGRRNRHVGDRGVDANGRGGGNRQRAGQTVHGFRAECSSVRNICVRSVRLQPDQKQQQRRGDERAHHTSIIELQSRRANKTTGRPKKPQDSQSWQTKAISARAAFYAIAFLVAIAPAVWWWWSHDGGAHIRSGDCRGCNVLLVTIDTLRLDRVGAFGSRRGLTP